MILRANLAALDKFTSANLDLEQAPLPLMRCARRRARSANIREYPMESNDVSLQSCAAFCHCRALRRICRLEHVFGLRTERRGRARAWRGGVIRRGIDARRQVPPGHGCDRA